MTWTVYELEDPRTDEVFYIGISCRPEDRKIAHRCNPCSAAWSRIGEISAAGYRFRMWVVAEFETKQEAIDWEKNLISSTPNLCNIAGVA